MLNRDETLEPLLFQIESWLDRWPCAQGDRPRVHWGTDPVCTPCALASCARSSRIYPCPSTGSSVRRAECASGAPAHGGESLGTIPL